jgi:glycosyltransferase involved in cell wall biosynthesis
MYQSTALPDEPIAGGENLTVPSGALNGVTIMRYAHVYRERTSGGVEQYVRHLNQGLLQRHRITIVQMYLATDAKDIAIETEYVGMGRIVWVPVPIRQADAGLADVPERIGYIYRLSLAMYLQQGIGPVRAKLSSLHNSLRHNGGHLRYSVTVLSDHLPRLLEKYQVNLLALHWLCYETDDLISRALNTNVPFVIINHFNNARLSLPGTRKWITRAAALGSVSDCGVPDDLRGQCFPLSDAVNTQFFDPEKARPMRLAGAPPNRPVILLPARIQDGKGHRDLIEAAHILIGQQIDFVLCFAGAVDSESLHQELRRCAAVSGLEERVFFLGERTADEIRDLYALARLVVLPSHSEGLPRVLLEAQAMKKPVVAYDSGGIREAVMSNHTGLLVRTGDVQALAEKIRLLLEDGTERLRMGNRGREFVSRQFSVASLVQRHETFYLNALPGVQAGQKSLPMRSAQAVAN